MGNYIELSYSDITNIMLKIRQFAVEQSGANVILTTLTSRSFSAEFTLYGVVSESENVYVDSIEGDEENPVLRCTVCDEEGSSESMYPERISGKLMFWNHGLIEEESATPRDIFERIIAGVYEKNSYLGDKFLNGAEKKIASESDYLVLLLYPESVISFSKDDLLSAREYVKDGTAFAGYIDRFIKVSLGVPGRKNREKLIKAADKYYETEFDRDKYVALCKDAVKDMPLYAEDEALEKYSELKDRISSVMKNAGYSGEYPCFENGEKYVSFNADIFGSEIGSLSARFGINGAKARKYANKTTGDDRIIVLCENLETDAQVTSFAEGIFAVLDGKRPSKDYEDMVLVNSGSSSLERAIGVLFIILALCLVAVAFVGNTKNAVYGLVYAAPLLVGGLYLIFSKRKIHVLKADKGDNR